MSSLIYLKNRDKPIEVKVGTHQLSKYIWPKGLDNFGHCLDLQLKNSHNKVYITIGDIQYIEEKHDS